ncbi:hypothetical protein WA026_020278 [Henosepilachna vigintioctopunctata]|uniref:Gustatory receptor n=1 Tax=Henosepilachna vigintioctopunctata TaxID=420089 RepID=A0AAW1TYY1_9CUCU
MRNDLRLIRMTQKFSGIFGLLSHFYINDLNVTMRRAYKCYAFVNIIMVYTLIVFHFYRKMTDTYAAIEKKTDLIGDVLTDIALVLWNFICHFIIYFRTQQYGIILKVFEEFDAKFENNEEHNQTECFIHFLCIGVIYVSIFVYGAAEFENVYNESRSLLLLMSVLLRFYSRTNACFILITCILFLNCLNNRYNEMKMNIGMFRMEHAENTEGTIEVAWYVSRLHEVIISFNKTFGITLLTFLLIQTIYILQILNEIYLGSALKPGIFAALMIVMVS